MEECFEYETRHMPITRVEYSLCQFITEGVYRCTYDFWLITILVFDKQND